MGTSDDGRVPDEPDTPPVEAVRLPGYETGFRDGCRLAADRAFELFRDALIEGGTEVGEAYLLAEKFKRYAKAHGL